MGVTPKDYDVATDARPEQVQALFEHTVGVGAQFGVILVVLDQNLQYEVATFRAEADYSDGRRPNEVRWASAYEDVIRRDFTINGLLFDPEAEEIVDHVGGVNDIEAGVIRAIGDPHQRFSEDKLRLLRAIRFAARLDFQVEPATYDAVKEHAAEIAVVSAERVAAEYDRILSEGGAARGLELLEDSALLRFTLPELGQPEAAMRRLQETAPLDPDTAWALTLLDLTVDEVGLITERMRMSRKRRRAITEAVTLAQRLLSYETLSTAQKKRIIRHEESHRALLAASRASEAGQRPPRGVAAAASDKARWSRDDLFPPRLMDGARLKALGLAPGPQFAHVLRRVEDGQLAGEVTTAAEADALVRSVTLRPSGASVDARRPAE